MQRNGGGTEEEAQAQTQREGQGGLISASAGSVLPILVQGGLSFTQYLWDASYKAMAYFSFFLFFYLCLLTICEAGVLPLL